MNDLRSSYRQKAHMNAALTVCKRPSEVSGQLNLNKKGGGRNSSRLMCLFWDLIYNFKYSVMLLIEMHNSKLF